MLPARHTADVEVPAWVRFAEDLRLGMSRKLGRRSLPALALRLMAAPDLDARLVAVGSTFVVVVVDDDLMKKKNERGCATSKSCSSMQGVRASGGN